MAIRDQLIRSAEEIVGVVNNDGNTFGLMLILHESSVSLTSLLPLDYEKL
jgi:hypothetical protein